MTYFHLLPFVKNEQYGEGEMNQAVVFVYLFSFHLILHLLFLLMKSVKHGHHCFTCRYPAYFHLSLLFFPFFIF